jgi:CubicO group peptidase (beta-lactamase class C family)
MPIQLSEQVDQFIEKIMGVHEFAGLAVGIVLDTQIVYAKGFGVQNIETKEPLTPDSLFSIASISKTFVATAIMQLVDQGKIALDTPLVTCLPYFHIADARYKQITISQMLSHISGMPDIEDYMWEPPAYDDGALERYVRNMGKVTLEFPPGEKFVYSNTAYDILGLVIAEVSGQSFEDYIEQHILLPLGMQNSTFLYKKASPARITSPYLSLPNLEAAPLYPYYRDHAPCGSLHTNMMELSHWAIANLNKGQFDGSQVISPASHDLLWQPRVMVDNKNPDEYIGLCWFLGKYKGEKTVGHTGGDIGFRTNLALLPDKSAGVVVLSNTYPAPTDAITNALLDIILGNEPSPPKPGILRILNPALKTRGVEAALEVYHRMKAAQPDDYDFSSEQFAIVGYVLIEIRKLAEAKDVLRLGIEIDPKSDRLYYEMARAMMQSGEIDKAIQNCRQCLTINPDHWEAAKLLRELQHN